MRTKSKYPTRTKWLTVRMLESEWEALKQRASAANQTIPNYVRVRLLADYLPVPAIQRKKSNNSQSEASALLQSKQSQNEKLNEKLSASEIEGICARKTNHVLGCDCVVCEKQRRRLRDFLGKQSAND
jgi:mobilization protein NikA